MKKHYQILLIFAVFGVLSASCKKNSVPDDTTVVAPPDTIRTVAYKDSVFTEYFRKTSGWIASDATISLPLSNNKVLWLFGDTYIDGYRASDTSLNCFFQVRNSMLLQDKQNPSQLLTILDNTQAGVNRTPIKIGDNSTYFWPGHGYAEQDTAFVFWQEYMGANYTLLGNYISKIYTPGMVDASAIKDLIKLPLPDGLTYGTSILIDSVGGYRYIYGSKQDWIVHRPLVARLSINKDITEPWEFYTGSGWSSSANDGAALLTGSKGHVSPSYSVIKIQGKYYMISQDNGFLTCGLGRDIYAWRSDTPYGPFTDKTLLYTIEDKYRGSYYITYNATAHPQFTTNNELLISYNVNDICPAQCGASGGRRNADGYRPKFIRVPFSVIDPALTTPVN